MPPAELYQPLMSDESFENINQDLTLKGVIESDHWRSVDDPVGFIAYTLYVIDLETGFAPRDHLYDTFQVCVDMAEKNYGFCKDTWIKRELKISPPILKHRIPKEKLEELDQKITKIVADNKFKSQSSSSQD